MARQRRAPSFLVYSDFAVGSSELMRGRTDNELEAQIQGLFT
jgi:hypothetical protein